MFLSGVLTAQNKISGKVKDTAGEFIVGATVNIEGSGAFAVTGLDGEFTLDAPGRYPLILQVNYVGFEEQEIRLQGRENNPLEIVLRSNNLLDEVVIIGYGSRRKGELTGAVAKVPEGLIERQPVASVDRALQGALAGVQVTQSSGQPGGGMSIRIRGGGSIQGGNEPLYVIDGFPVYNEEASAGVASGAPVNPLAALNPADIESIDVLKDAAATAIYGSRGANGVIIITTKKGDREKSQASYHFNYGIQSLRKEIDVLEAPEFARLRNEALFDRNPAGGTNQYLSEEEIAQLDAGTDWQSAAFQNAPQQSHDLSLTGGTEKTRYAVSGNYFKQEGIIRNTGFERISARINLDTRLSEKVDFGMNLTGSTTASDVAPSGIVNALLLMPPTATIYEADGSYTLRNPFENIISNPIASLNEQINRIKSLRLLGTAFGKYEILDGLFIKVLLGANLSNSKEESYIPSTLFEGVPVNGEAALGSVNTVSWLNENTLDYTKAFGSHTFNALLGFTQQEFNSSAFQSGARQFVTDDLAFNSLQSGAAPIPPSSNAYSWSLLSYLARFNYNFAGKYYFSASIRADGSSRFGKSNKWGYFPSVAFSWRIANEDFFPASGVLSDLKLRLSYGATGNQEIGVYQSLSTLSSVRLLLGDNFVTGFTPDRIANDDLGWETTYQFNAGLDIGLWNNRATLTLDAYHKRTEDLLLNVAIPWTTGHSTSLQNFGSVENKGLELTLNTVNLRGALNWNTSFNISFNRNRVLQIGSESDDFILGGNFNGDFIIKVGEPLGSYFDAGVGYFAVDLGTEYYQGFLSDRTVTIAEALRENGYCTYLSGKWHLGDQPGNQPNHRGFDSFYGFLGGASTFFGKVPFRDEPAKFWRHGTEIEAPLSEDFYLTDAITDEAIAMVDSSRSSGRPFFLYLAYNAPHWPLHALPEDIEKYRGKYDLGWDSIAEQRHLRLVELGIVDPDHPRPARPATIPAWESLSEEERRHWAHRMEVHAAMVDRMDQNIGKLIDNLKDQGVFENTVFFFLSDNGAAGENVDRLFSRPENNNGTNGLPAQSAVQEAPVVGTPDSYYSITHRWAYAANSPFSYWKAFPYEGGIATPFIASCPNRIRKNAVVQGRGHIIDVFPTILELTGSSYPSETNDRDLLPLAGKSLLPALTGTAETINENLFFERAGNKAVRAGKWKLLQLRGRKDWHLFDIENDRGETIDLAGQYPDRVNQMIGAYQSWARDHHVADTDSLLRASGNRMLQFEARLLETVDVQEGTRVQDP